MDFLGFFKNFEKLFGIKRFKVYVTGESYAGRYVPYISAAMLDEKDKENFDLGGESAQFGSYRMWCLLHSLTLAQEHWCTTPASANTTISRKCPPCPLSGTTSTCSTLTAPS